MTVDIDAAQEETMEALRAALQQASDLGLLLPKAAAYYLDQIEKAMAHKRFLDLMPDSEVDDA